MPEPVDRWWERRQRSKSATVPYPIGRYRSEWERYPVLIRQFHPDLNAGITLTQIPPAADVYLTWICDSGHRFVATPDEQRSRPGSSRRRSSWCPECAAAALRRSARSVVLAADPERHTCGHPVDPRRFDRDPDDDRCLLCRRLTDVGMSREQLLSRVTPGSRAQLAEETTTVRRYHWVCQRGHGSYEARVESILAGRRCTVCAHAAGGADAVAVGEAFSSRWAPATASAAEAMVRMRLAERLDVDLSKNAVRVARPFFSHLEVWPDIVIPDLRVAIEYDTTGRDGLEHVGRREEADRRKDRLLRAAGWQVVRVRCGKLQPIGPYDLVAGGVSALLVDRLVDQLAVIRGELIVAAYRRPSRLFAPTVDRS